MTNPETSSDLVKLLPDKCKMRAHSRYASDEDCANCGLGEGDVCPEYQAQSDASIAAKKVAPANAPVAWRFRVSGNQLNWNFWGDSVQPEWAGIAAMEPLYDATTIERLTAERSIEITGEGRGGGLQTITVCDHENDEQSILFVRQSRLAAAESLNARQAEVLKEVESHIEALRPFKTAPAVVGVINWLHRLATLTKGPSNG